MKKELWLEFGAVGKDDWHDMFWYNEGNANEIGYFIRHFLKDIFIPNRYFLMRYGSFSWYLRGKPVK